MKNEEDKQIEAWAIHTFGQQLSMPFCGDQAEFEVFSEWVML